MLRASVTKNYGTIIRKTAWPRPFEVPPSRFKSYLYANDLKIRTDPFKEWLESLPEWDEIPRIDHLFAELFTEHPRAPENSLSSPFGMWASRWMFIAATQTTLHPEDDNPELRVEVRPMLCGEQGIGKSAMIHTLLPRGHGWINPSFVVDSSIRFMQRQTKGTVISECPNMAGLHRMNASYWLVFANQRRFSTWLISKKKPETHFRRGIIIGTTNDIRRTYYPTYGWSRDLPVLLGLAPRAVEPYILEHREQMWAEAIVKVKSGVRAELPRYMREEAIEHSEQYHRLISPVKEAVDRLPQEFEPTPVEDLMVQCGLISSQADMSWLNPELINAFVDELYRRGADNFISNRKWGREQGHSMWKRKTL